MTREHPTSGTPDAPIHPPDHLTAGVTVVSGGVGAARFVRALRTIVPDHAITAVVNTGDDTTVHGLRICPDLDTVTYTVAGAIDPDRGWGLAGESWITMEALGRYAAVRPEGSSAASTWFNLGDRDLATHCYRTARLAEGARLTDVTAEICRAWDLDVRVLPMTDHRFATLVVTEDHGTVSFQDYFVRLRHDVEVRDVMFDHDHATVTDEALAAIRDAEVVVIAPSNPVVSIGPIRALPDVDRVLAARRDAVVAVSPIVGGAALKGPADRLLRSLGHDASVVGVARWYRDVCATLVIDEADAHLADDVRAEGMACVVTRTIMSEPGVGPELARAVLDAARQRSAG